MAQRNLYFIRDEEPAGTSVVAQSKAKMFGRRRYKLRVSFVAGGLSHLQETIRIKGFRVIVEPRVVHPFRRYHD